MSDEVVRLRALAREIDHLLSDDIPVNDFVMKSLPVLLQCYEALLLASGRIESERLVAQ